MNKSEVCVKLTRKNCKKVLGILDMFGERVWKYSRLNEGGPRRQCAFAMIEDCGEEWLISSTPDGKTEVKPRELRNILAREHLRVGEAAVLKNSDGEKIGRVIEITTECIFIKDKWNDTWTGDFLRYATDEEKALLEPMNQVKAKEVISPEQRFPLFPHQSYTREIWVNHYSDQEFHIHYNKEIAELHSRINNGFGRDAKTVKATLTYDIPMTKV